MMYRIYIVTSRLGSDGIFSEVPRRDWPRVPWFTRSVCRPPSFTEVLGGPCIVVSGGRPPTIMVIVLVRVLIIVFMITTSDLQVEQSPMELLSLWRAGSVESIVHAHDSGGSAKKLK